MAKSYDVDQYNTISELEDLIVDLEMVIAMVDTTPEVRNICLATKKEALLKLRGLRRLHGK